MDGQVHVCDDEEKYEERKGIVILVVDLTVCSGAVLPPATSAACLGVIAAVKLSADLDIELIITKALCGGPDEQCPALSPCTCTMYTPVARGARKSANALDVHPQIFSYSNDSEQDLNETDPDLRQITV